jgi:hypothetical protein
MTFRACQNGDSNERPNEQEVEDHKQNPKRVAAACS